MRRVQRGVAALVVAGSLVGCGGPAIPSVTSAPTTAPTPAPTAGASAPTSAGVVVDPALLEALPAAIDGIDRQADDETAREIAGATDLAPSVDGLAVGLYIGPGADGAEDLAIVSVARLRPGVVSDAWFRSWRDTYDEAACEPAGGRTAGSAQVELGGRTAYIGTCRNGAHTYHVRLADPDRVVAITSVGDGRLGERVVSGLEE